MIAIRFVSIYKPFLCFVALQRGSLVKIPDSLDNTSAVSYTHLDVYKRQRLVRSRRDGKMAYYSLDDEHVREIFDKGLAHIEER